jgi:hypothetical protein
MKKNKFHFYRKRTKMTVTSAEAANLARGGDMEGVVVVVGAGSVVVVVVEQSHSAKLSRFPFTLCLSIFSIAKPNCSMKKSQS